MHPLAISEATLLTLTFIILGLFTAFWIWMLLECAMYEASEGNTKVIWIGIILFLSWIGALLYFFVRRPQRKEELGR